MMTGSPFFLATARRQATSRQTLSTNGKLWGMRAWLKGINSKRVTRASSRKVSYYDEWKVARVSQESREVSSCSPPGAT
jgi:hypothetical protein